MRPMWHLAPVLVIVSVGPGVGAEAPRPFPDTAIQLAAGEHPSDETLSRRVQEALHKDTRIFWEVLDVRAVAGKVDIFGKVRTEKERDLATAVAQAVPGVRSVANHVLIRAAQHEQRSSIERQRGTDRPRSGSEGER